MKNNFDLKKFLVENKLTTNSKTLNEDSTPEKLKKLTVGGKTYELGDFDPNDDGRIMSIEKYTNGYFITGGVYSDYGDGDEPKEGYGYAIDLDGNQMDEDDLDGNQIDEDDLRRFTQQSVSEAEGGLASAATQEFINADSNGVSIAEFVKAIIDGAAEEMGEEAEYYDLDRASMAILKAIGRQDLIGD